VIFRLLAICKCHVINVGKTAHCSCDRCAAVACTGFAFAIAVKIKALVGAGRFELPTPCAQGIGAPENEMP